MASSSTLSLCSSLASQCRLSPPNPHAHHHHHHHPSSSIYFPPSSKATVAPLASLKLAPSRPSSSSSFTAKSSESDAPVIEFAPEATEPEPEPEPEPAPAVPSPGDAPKREEVFAVVMVGSRQYIVFPGRYIYTQRLKGASVDDKIILNKVLLVGTKTSTYIGKPVVPNAAVHAVVEEQGLDPKVIVFKYKKKKKYRRNIGHRQPNTRIRITGVTGYQDSPAVTLDS
ncbi:50S ribosomal protein L21, chloroplastic [Syzygium oleosum]|uniref:50S ribosomal protein L21, chloroplastic n=1 Tax=Syzygium oleosum TaxID=219896 RepID=UPI0011D1EBA5|nr:50S ribosomal protein L21, chloroplastic [Syzygium oleosum]